MATAPFDQRLVAVRVEHRGLRYLGITLGARAPSLDYHLVQRVLTDEQWRGGTTAEVYLADLRHSIRHPTSELAVYERRGGRLVATSTATSEVLVYPRRGTRWLTELLVVYSVERGSLLSGCHISSRAAAGIPQEARWIK